MINGLFEVTRAGGGMGVPGIYAAGDPEAKDAKAKQGRYELDFGKAWIKSPTLTAGQCPVKKYNRNLMMAILWDRMPYLSEVMNPEVIPLDQAIDAYRAFGEGSPKKFIIDPHGSLKDFRKGKEAQRVSKGELAHA